MVRIIPFKVVKTVLVEEVQAPFELELGEGREVLDELKVALMHEFELRVLLHAI